MRILFYLIQFRMRTDKMKIIHKILIFNVIAVTISSVTLAQEDWEGMGEIEEAEVIIEKERKVVLPRTRRIFEKVPSFELQSGILGLKYNYIPSKFVPGDLRTRVRPLTIKTQSLPVVRGNNVKLGYGNYGTAYLEGSMGTIRNDEHSFNLFIRHRSSAKGPVADENSGDSESIADLSGNIFLNQATIWGKLSYRRDAFDFYGYNPADTIFRLIELNPDAFKQVLNNFTFAGKITTNLPDKESGYSVQAIFDYVQDYYSATEADFGFNFFGRIPIQENYTIEIISDLYLINRKDERTPSYNRHFVRIKPYLNYTLDNLDMSLGFSAVFVNDTLGEDKSFRFFPLFNVSYSISRNTEAYGGFRADVDKISLKSLLHENRHLSPEIDVFNQIRTFDFYAGIKGKLGKAWSYDIGTDLIYFKNRPYFINDPADTIKFTVIYDTKSSSYNHLRGSIGYDVTKNINIGLNAEHFFYHTSDQVTEAWHRPAYDITFLSTFALFEKFKFTADAYVMGGLKARDPGTGTVIEMDAIQDIDLGFSYLISEQASVFFKTFNVIGRKNQRYLNYSTRGLQWLAGLSYSF